jgi:Cof subfamily protein (haloacid dehalogenase superfamily)
MKPAIVFFDIDGTLLDHNKRVPESTKKAIQTLQDSGVITAIATGRAPFMYDDIREQLGIDSYISFNGQYVVHQNKEIFKNPISHEWLSHLDQVTRKNGHPVAYLGSREMGATHKDHPFINRSFASLKQPVPPLEPGFYEKNEIFQALLFFDTNADLSYLDEHEAFDTLKWHEHSLDIIPKGGTKAGGIRAMLDHLGLHPNQAAAFGDGLNDVEMLQFVGHGVAMGNGVEVAKKASRFVTEAVDRDGISRGLEKLGLL